MKTSRTTSKGYEVQVDFFFFSGEENLILNICLIRLNDLALFIKGISFRNHSTTGSQAHVPHTSALVTLLRKHCIVTITYPSVVSVIFASWRVGRIPPSNTWSLVWDSCDQIINV